MFETTVYGEHTDPKNRDDKITYVRAESASYGFGCEVPAGKFEVVGSTDHDFEVAFNEQNDLSDMDPWSRENDDTDYTHGAYVTSIEVLY